MQTVENEIQVMTADQVLSVIDLPALPSTKVNWKSKGSDLVKQAEKIGSKEITKQADCNHANNVRTILKRIEKYIQDERLKLTAPVRDWLTNFKAAFDTKLEPIANARLATEIQIRIYDTKQEAIRQAEANRIAKENFEAEQKRQAEIARRKKISDSQNGDGKNIKEVAPIEKQAAPAPLSMTRTTKYKQRVVVKITDITKVPRDYLQGDEVTEAARKVVQRYINAKVKDCGGAGKVRMCDIEQIPGVEIEKIRDITS